MICKKCGKEVEKLTRDHIIPQWFFKPDRLLYLQLRNKKEKWGKLIKDKYTEMICRECNAKKGGIMDFSHPVVRGYIQECIEKWQVLLDKYK